MHYIPLVLLFLMSTTFANPIAQEWDVELSSLEDPRGNYEVAAECEPEVFDGQSEGNQNENSLKKRSSSCQINGHRSGALNPSSGSSNALQTHPEDSTGGTSGGSNKKCPDPVYHIHVSCAEHLVTDVSNSHPVIKFLPNQPLVYSSVLNYRNGELQYLLPGNQTHLKFRNCV